MRASSLLDTRLYEVGPLLAGKELDELIDVITTCVSPDSWSDAGGPGSVLRVQAAKVLVVRQTDDKHEELARFLQALHRGTSGARALPPEVDRESSIHDKLRKTCAIDADERPLNQILAKLASEQGIPLWIDQQSLLDEGVEIDRLQSIHVNGIRLESALNQLLAPQLLSWFVEDDVLKISTQVVCGERLQTRIYDVRDLVGPAKLSWPPQAILAISPQGSHGVGAMGGGMFQIDASPRPLILHGGFTGLPQGMGNPKQPKWRLHREYDFEELTRIITASIQPDSWDAVGGPGSLADFRHALIVRQTESAHREIEELLRGLRTVLRRQGEQKPPADESPETMKRVVYDLADFDYPPEDLARMIPEVLYPGTWQSANSGGNATIHVQPKALVITQTPAAHEEIVKLLYQVVLKVRE
jgi:hypothetical protein